MFPADTRFLIVDDMPSLRQILKAHLRRLGYHNISEAEDGIQALQMMVAAKTTVSPFQVVISDWNMPNLDGVAFLKKVRATKEWKNLPFILLTTESEKGKVLEAVVANVSNYIVKPIDEDTLRDKLFKVWEKVGQPSN